MGDGTADKVADAVSQPIFVDVVPSRSSAALDCRSGNRIEANYLLGVGHLVPFLSRAHNSISYDFANVDQRDFARVAALLDNGSNGT